MSNADAPAAPLDRAVEEARESLYDARKIIDKWIIGHKGPPKSEIAGHVIILSDAIRSLLAALDADRGEAEAKAAELERGLAAVMGQRDQHEVEAKNACEKIGVLQRVLGEECEAKREAERLLLVHTSSAVKYQAALVEAEAALRYYSNSEIYEETTTTHGLVPACGPPIVIEDGGEVARRYFARREREKGGNRG